MDTNKNKNIQFYSFEKIRTIILGVFLSMGPMFWFPHIGKLHYIKAFILFVLFLLYRKEILQKKEKLHFCFFCVTLFFTISTINYRDSLYERVVSLYLLIFCAWIMMCIGTTIKDVRPINIAFLITGAYCVPLVLNEIMGGKLLNLTFNYAPMLPNGEYQYLELKEVGWGFGRTQWSSCLSNIFVGIIPFLYEFKNKKNTNLFLYIFGLVMGGFIVLAQIYSNGRSGMLASLLIYVFCLYIFRKNHFHAFCKIFILLLLVLYLIYLNFTELRLDSEDVSTHRFEQWDVLFSVLKDVPFNGFGDYGNIKLDSYGVPYAFHNSFVRIILGFGFWGIMIVCVFLFNIVRFSWRRIDKGNVLFLTSFACVGAGMVSSLFEPNPIIESLYWPLWWLSFGYLYMNFQTGEKNDTHLKQQAENMIQSR